MHINQKQLEEILTKFQGTLLGPNSVNDYVRSSLTFFSNTDNIPDPRIEFTTQLDITEIYKTYQEDYKNTAGATFTAYIKWQFLRAMENSPFNWRYLNGEWYNFKNLPLEVTMRWEDKQRVCFLYDVAKCSWEEFCKLHRELAQGKMPDLLEQANPLPLWAIANEIVGLHIPKMTSYKTSRKLPYTHQPWIVFSDRYLEEGQIMMPVHLSFSHASVIPKTAEEMLGRFVTLAQQPKWETEFESKWSQIKAKL